MVTSAVQHTTWLEIYPGWTLPCGPVPSGPIRSDLTNPPRARLLMPPLAASRWTAHGPICSHTHTHTHTQLHTHTHARTHIRTCTHTHTHKVDPTRFELRSSCSSTCHRPSCWSVFWMRPRANSKFMRHATPQHLNFTTDVNTRLRFSSVQCVVW